MPHDTSPNLEPDTNAHLPRDAPVFADDAATAAERAVHDRRRSELRAALRAGIAIRNAREGAGLTQTELAARIGIAQSALSRIEAGRANLTLGTLQRVTEALDLPLRLAVGSHEITLTTA